ncbi:MAG: 2-oxoacid:ferredoxin oxidoreductase subunit beta [Candidatus Eisenbacteria bacterium]|nr:2-oxoacid:ferredoxin oxidoreductase subunit beta [Candidatus Latescibacterota bacterium]MBD3302794.1 2-oxoacid:ferredoxin oxidoreductase subunit beta [Candidatus Eisenbacteria bacterium]
MSTAASERGMTKKDFQSDQEVRWCPGCGDYAILNAVQQVFPQLGIPRERFVIVSGIGCSSRFPYYMNTFGFHTIHGRAPAVATGIKLANPDLSVWIATGDGDALSIGGNHLIHALRRNIDIKILMFNNRIYGLTKGQYSPTSEQFKKTKSTPFGSLDRPFEPISLALGAGATFVARSVDVIGPHLREVLKRAAAHRGSAFIEIFQNCNIFNDGAFDTWVDRKVRDDRLLPLEHGEPLQYGKERKFGIVRGDCELDVVELDGDGDEKNLLRHDAKREDPAFAFELAHFGEDPTHPMPIGIFRDVEYPSFDGLVHRQLDEVRAAKGEPSIQKALSAGEIWQVS